MYEILIIRSSSPVLLTYTRLPRPNFRFFEFSSFFHSPLLRLLVIFRERFHGEGAVARNAKEKATISHELLTKYPACKLNDRIIPILISQSCRRGVQGARYLNPSVEHGSLGRLKHRIKVPGTRNISENLAFNGVSLLPRALFRFLPPPSLFLSCACSLLFKQILRHLSIED